MQLYKKNEDVFTDLGLSEENKMPQKSIVFKDAVWVEKEGDKDIYIYVYTCICTDHLWNYTQETANWLLPGKLMKGRTTGDSPLYAVVPLEFQTIWMYYLKRNIN